MECDFRYVSHDDLPKLKKMVYAIVEKNFVPDVTTKFTDTFGFDEMERTEATMQLLEVAKEAAKESGLPVPGPKLCGGSDSANLTAVGIPTLCALGVKGEFNHTEREWADEASLYERTKLLMTFLCEL